VESFPFVHRKTVRFRDLDAEAKSVLVGYDYERGESIPIPDRWRKRLSIEHV
jgi:acyl-CoA thioesterase FadM